MKLIGRPGSRYATETYPLGPGGGGGGGGASVPLTRQRFIDGGTATTGRTGAAAEPFKTIAEFLASRTNASVEDATANYVGWVTPSLAGYVENVAFPAYASTELRADSIAQPGAGTAITGNVTWANIAGTHTASPNAVVAMHNITVSGGITITDDVGAPSSTFAFGGDEVGDDSAVIGGAFDSSATTKLSGAIFTNALLNGGVNAGTTADSAFAVFVHSEISGTVAARSIQAFDSVFSSSTIDVNSSGTAEFHGCSFFSGSNPVLTALAGASFDGPSWKSFIESGGTRSPAGDAGTPVLVIGGNSGAEVEGAAIVTSSGTKDLSLNGTGATAGFQGSNSGNHYTFIAQTGDATAHLLTGGGEKSGDTMLITRADLAAHDLTVTNNAATVLGVIPSGSRGFIEALFNGTDWVFLKGGSLAA